MPASVQTLGALGTGATTSLVLDKPSGTVEGDLMIAHIFQKRSTTTLDDPGGWTEIQQSSTASDTGGGGTMATFYKVATGAEGTTYTFTASDSDPMKGRIVRISGQAPTSPVSASSEQVDDSADTTADGATITPVNTSSLILFFVACITDGGNPATSAYAIATSNPTWTEQYDNQETNVGNLALATANRTEVTATSTASATASASSKSIVHMVAVAGNLSDSVDVGVLTLTGPEVGWNISDGVPTGVLTLSGPEVTPVAVNNEFTNPDKSSSSWTSLDKS